MKGLSGMHPAARSQGGAGAEGGVEPEAPSDAGERASELTEALFSFELSLEQLAFTLSALIVSFALALPIAWDRERKHYSPGLRTFPLVAMASCAYVLVAISVLEGNLDAHSRVLQGLVTGIGFVGGGAILKSPGAVRGTATAASIWAMGALGAAVAYRRLEIALIVTAVTLATLRWLEPLKPRSPAPPSGDADS